jgi:hypothetical protein
VDSSRLVMLGAGVVPMGVIEGVQYVSYGCHSYLLQSIPVHEEAVTSLAVKMVASIAAVCKECPVRSETPPALPAINHVCKFRCVAGRRWVLDIEVGKAQNLKPANSRSLSIG